MKIFSKWMKRLGMGLITLIVILLTAGFFFETISRNDAEKIKPSGNFAEIGDHRLHYYKKGFGGPTIIFESAFDPAGHLQWYHIQQELPMSYTSLSYDRAGILWSDRGKNPKSGKEIAKELYLLLKITNAPKPYIIVGHSFGGTLARIFVNNYPEDVAAVILVDSQCPDDAKYLSPKLYKMVNQGLPTGFLKLANTFGVVRLMFKNMFPNEKRYQYQNALMPTLLYKSADALFEEQNNMASIKKEASIIHSLGNTPVYVLTAADESRYNSLFKDENLKMEMINGWKKMQNDFLGLSTNSKQILIQNSGHYINQEQPEVIISTINDIVGKIPYHN